ncbi:MAG: hypothetical protein R3F38_19120 [Gammaproteobacteria bacterium]
MSSVKTGKASFLQPSIRIDVRWVLDGLLEDGRITERDVNFIAGQRREKTELNWNPLQFVAKFNLTDQQDDGNRLTLEKLTDWLAKRANQPVYHIDPLKVDVAAITAVMSFNFAERHEILAVAVDKETVTIASGQPFLSDWEHGLEQTLRGKRIKRVIINPADLKRFTLEFYNLARSVKGAAGKGRRPVQRHQLEQLLQLGELTSPDANDQHIVKTVDLVAAICLRPAGQRYPPEPRRDTGKHPFPASTGSCTMSTNCRRRCWQRLPAGSRSSAAWMWRKSAGPRMAV